MIKKYFHMSLDIVASEYKRFLVLNPYIKIFILFSICFGTIIRVVNLFHSGYFYDTGLQYEWGYTASVMGYANFWKNYTGSFDYLPGSLWLFWFLAEISKHLYQGSHGFIFLLKLFNVVCDVIFVLITFISARIFGKHSTNKAYIILGIAYVMPSLWFVSAVWGQIDTPLVTLCLLSVFLLFLRQRYMDRNNINPTFFKDFAFYSGFVLGLAFWMKEQTLLILPMLAIYYFSNKDYRCLFRQFIGLVISSILISIIPALSSIYRLGAVLVTPYSRDDILSNSASTFWLLIGKYTYGNDVIIYLGKFPLTPTYVGILIYIVFMITLYILVFNVKIKKVLTLNTSALIKELFPRRMEFIDFCLLVTISSTIYFMFFSKMHSRYLHMGVLFAIFSLSLITSVKYFKYWLSFVILINISYLLNLANLYQLNFANPKIIQEVFRYLRFDVYSLAALINLFCLICMYILVIRIHKNRNSAK